MQKTVNEQKKKIILSYVYATIIGVLVVACAIVIALVNNKNSTPPTENVTPGDSIPVAVVTYVVPMQNATIAKDYSSTELQFNDSLKQWEIHKAIDFLANDNTDVFAVSNGTISNIYTNYLEGTVIEISHSNGLVSIYKSLDKEVTVSVGDVVTAGQKIGIAGSSMAQELNTGAHLHLEMLLNGTKVNPSNYIDLGTK